MTATLLIAGVPRSGSTWTARVLSAAPDACLVGEPDNAYEQPYALAIKRRIGQYTHPSAAARDPRFRHLWLQAVDRSPERSATTRIRRSLALRVFATLQPADVARALDGDVALRARLAMLMSAPARPSAPRVVVKTVHGSLVLEWIAAQIDATVIVVQRHPAAVLASWQRMDWIRRPGWRLPREVAVALVDDADDVPADDDALSPLEWAAWNLCTLLAHQQALTLRHPEWHRVDHEKACVDPHTFFRTLADRIGWAWHPDMDAFITRSTRPGTGYDTNRLPDEAIGAWRRELDARQVAMIAAVQRRFPLLRRWASTR